MCVGVYTLRVKGRPLTLCANEFICSMGAVNLEITCIFQRFPGMQVGEPIEIYLFVW